MDHHAVLIGGATSLAQLRDLIAPVTPSDVYEYDYGLKFGHGAYGIVDNEIVGDYYEDDLGLPLSRYRFEAWSSALSGHEWAGRVFALLSEQTALDLLWLTNSQRVEAERTLSAVA